MSNALPANPQAPSTTGYDPTDREREMYRLRTLEGLTLPEIGERYDISAERVRQILNRTFRLTGAPPAVKARRSRGTPAKPPGSPERERTPASAPASRGAPVDRESSGFQSRVTPAPDPRLSRSLEYGAALLECFTAGRPALRISELADMVGISRSTTHRYATTLVELGYLEQDAKRRYRLTQGAARPGMAVIDTIRLGTPARTILEDLRTETGYTVSLGLLTGARAVYIYRLSGHGAGQYEADGHIGVGANVPAHCTAVGKALLSTLLDSELRTLLPDMALDCDWSNVTEAEALVVDGIERVRRNGIALEQDIYGEGARSLAVPATRWLDKPIVAVEVTAPAGIHTMEEMLARLGPPLKHAAKLISV